MFLKKEFKVSMDIAIYQHEIADIDCNPTDLEKLMRSVMYGEFKNTPNDGPIWIEHIYIHDNDNQWKLSMD